MLARVDALSCLLMKTFVALTMSTFLLSTNSGSALNLTLPTPNDAIFKGGGEAYYMYVDRNFQGVKSTPWEGGTFGNVRTPVVTGGTTVYSRFHGGIDIKPAKRDPGGVPLDPVMSIDDGKVAYVNDAAGASNYGRYIVIEHNWEGSPFYSLYAHLRTTEVQAGQTVARGERIGMLGWTGAGINLTRAHLHLEINMLMTSRYQIWHDANFGTSKNHHGIHNGMNFYGFDPSEILIRAHTEPEFTMSRFIREQEAMFKVRIANTPEFELVRRYPMLVRNDTIQNPVSWIIGFDQAGVPVSAEPSGDDTSAPVLVSIRNSEVPYQYVTRGLVQGGQGNARLSARGARFMQLLAP